MKNNEVELKYVELNQAKDHDHMSVTIVLKDKSLFSFNFSGRSVISPKNKVLYLIQSDFELLKKYLKALGKEL